MVKAKSKVTISRYGIIHAWLRHNYGKANRCESSDCLKITKFFEWALKIGLEYEKNRGNFIQLCRSCHRKMDFNEDIRQNMRKAQLGKKQPRKGVEMRAKLKPTDVLYIYSQKGITKTKELSKQFKVSVQEIRDILGKRKWKCITSHQT